MLTDEQVIKARELIASRELSQRQIARLLGISRTMVQTIARGRRQLKVEREPSDEPEFRDRVEPVRCTGCGMMIDVIPCVYCAAMRYRDATKRRTLRGEPQQNKAVIGLKLRPEHERRYCDVLAARVHAELVSPSEELRNGGVMKREIRNKYVRWVLSNLEALEPVLSLPEAVRDEPSIRARWTAVRFCVDRILDVLDTSPLPFGPVDESEGKLREEASELGVSWAEILTALPYLVAMLDLVGPSRG
ncbi:MAG: hypothetical protein R3E01_11595 [Pirellulaceae bacterium]|nr:hypothetical protein [Planctomycetales bacterium]